MGNLIHFIHLNQNHFPAVPETVPQFRARAFKLVLTLNLSRECLPMQVTDTSWIILTLPNTISSSASKFETHLHIGVPWALSCWLVYSSKEVPGSLCLSPLHELFSPWTTLHNLFTLSPAVPVSEALPQRSLPSSSPSNLDLNPLIKVLITFMWKAACSTASSVHLLTCFPSYDSHHLSVSWT